MEKVNDTIGRSEKHALWGEIERQRRTRQFRTMMNAENVPEENRSMAYEALMAMPYVSNSASYWIDMRHMEIVDVAGKLSSYWQWLRRSADFRAKLADGICDTHGFGDATRHAMRHVSVDCLAGLKTMTLEQVATVINSLALEFPYWMDGYEPKEESQEGETFFDNDVEIVAF